MAHQDRSAQGVPAAAGNAGGRGPALPGGDLGERVPDAPREVHHDHLDADVPRSAEVHPGHHRRQHHHRCEAICSLGSHRKVFDSLTEASGRTRLC